MSFVWTYLDDNDEALGTSEVFAEREAAEEWMGQCWQDLLERGVEQVALEDRERGRRLYRMGLREQ